MNAALVSGLALVAALLSLPRRRSLAGAAALQQSVVRAGLTAGIVTGAVLAVLGRGPVECLVAGALLGTFAADRAHRSARRRTGRVRVAIERALPDALDLLAGLVEAGAPLGAALAAVGQRVEGPLRLELAACADALGSAGSRRAAFGLLRESGSADLARVGQALALADELGTGVAEQLRGQALVQRDLRRSRAREQAATAAPKIALAIGLLLVPAALSLVLGAELLSVLDAAGGS
jgi:Flp pilus assembly protein TadB